MKTNAIQIHSSIYHPDAIISVSKREIRGENQKACLNKVFT